MKTLVSFLIIISSLQLAVSQSENFVLNTQKVAGNDINWEATLTLQIPASVDNAFILELPAGLHMIPIQVSLNQGDLWLQNGTAPAPLDSVSTWQSVDQGIVFRFTPGFLRAGDNLQIKTMTTVSVNKTPAAGMINLRPWPDTGVAGEPGLSTALPEDWKNNTK